LKGIHIALHQSYSLEKYIHYAGNVEEEMRVKLHNETGQRIITSGQRIGHEFASAL